MDKFAKNTARHARYRRDILAGMTISLLVILLCILWWPIDDGFEEDLNVYDIRGQEVIELEDIQQTTQEEKRPPPPSPIPPIVVPDDVILEEIEIEITDMALAIEDPGNDDEIVEAAESGNTVARADRGPAPVMISEPQYTSEARRARIHAAIDVRVLVDRRGYVEETEIVGRYIYDRDGERREAVEEVGYGLEASALETARKWRFTPAIENGQRVASYTTITLTFGIN